MIAIDYGRLYASAPAAKAAPQPPAAPAPPPSPQPDPLQDPKAVAVEVHDRSATVYTPNGKGGLQASGPPAAEGSGKFSGFLRKTFLPSNYPSQVHSDYVPFRKWASVANFAQSGLEFFATQGILAGLGLSASAPTVATIGFFAKDALNFVGQIVGGAVARKADIEPVKWYARAQTISAVSRVAQTALIVAPGAFWVLAPASNAANAFASAIKGAATANIDNHQALGVNVGELKAKNGNQDLVTGAVGASLSIGLSMLAGKVLGAWGGPAVAVGMAALNLVAVRKAAAALEMDDLAEKQIRRLVHQQIVADRNCTPEDFADDRALRKLPDGPEIEVGVGLKEIAIDAAHFDRLRALYGADRYLLDYDGDKIRIVLAENADPEDQGRAIYQAQLLSELVSSPGYQKMVARGGDARARMEAMEVSHRALPGDFKTWLSQLQALGWETSRIPIDAGKVRVRWKPLPAAAQPTLSLGDFRKLLA